MVSNAAVRVVNSSDGKEEIARYDLSNSSIETAMIFAELCKTENEIKAIDKVSPEAWVLGELVSSYTFHRKRN